MRLSVLVLAVVVLDQAVKGWVKTHLFLFESVPLLGSWLRLTHLENPGVAFGWQLGPKGLVTLFTLACTGVIAAYLVRLRRATPVLRRSLALVLGGALGNGFDRTFYGVLDGYGPLFHGHVVDYLHVSGFVPVPFRAAPVYLGLPVGNLADVAILAGVVGVLWTYARARCRPAPPQPADVPSGAEA